MDGRVLPGHADSRRALASHRAANAVDRQDPSKSGYTPLGLASEAELTDHEFGRYGQIDEEDVPKVAASKTIQILTKMEKRGACVIDADSVYGAAVAMPQIARSAGWPGSLLCLTIRVYLFTALNFVLQAFLLSMIGEEQLAMYPFAGQMHLCDFAASLQDCPSGPNCRGPMGTIFTASRLYSFPIWSTRVFLRDSLKAVFPDMKDQIDQDVDPGEYGLENPYCRMACIFIFMLAVVDDLAATYQLARTLWNVPNRAQPWIAYDVPTWAEKREFKLIKNRTELDLVKFRVAGIPVYWKVLNFIFILFPKLLLWLALVKSGVHYLMETAGIVDTVVNAMALTFVLDVDEMVFHRFTSGLTKHIMSRIEDLPNFDTQDTDNESDKQALDRLLKTDFGRGKLQRVVVMLIPTRLIMVIALQALFMYDYYKENCITLEDGSVVSQAMSTPKDLSYEPIAWMFGFESNMMEASFWTMPGN